MATPTLDRMNSDHLRALVAAVDHGTFDAAADSLRISGSAFSQRIKALERQVGQVLLARTVPVRPTPAGERMLRLARQTLALRHQRQAAESGTQTGDVVGLNNDLLVELRGFEPLTPSMPWRCATNCATAPSGIPPKGTAEVYP